MQFIIKIQLFGKRLHIPFKTKYMYSVGHYSGSNTDFKRNTCIFFFFFKGLICKSDNLLVTQISIQIDVVFCTMKSK